MAQTIKLKRSAVAGRIPTTSDLDLGEVAINTYDGKMYMKKNVSGVESIVEVTSAQIPADPTFDSVTLTGAPGPIEWNALDETVDVPLNSDVTLQVGQETVFRGKAIEAIANGDAVMFAGAQGDHLLIAKADMSAVGFEPEHVIGIATQDFALNEFGFVTTFGKVRGLNTAALSEGDILYVDPSVAGGLTTTRPNPPNHIIQMCAVTKSHLTQGTFLVRPLHFHDTDEVPEGLTNLYFTDQRVFDAADNRYVNVTGDTMTGNLTINSGNVANQLLIRRSNPTSYQVGMYFSVDGFGERHFGMSTSQDPYWAPTANLGGGYKMWHEGNQGPGSGLDADTLDGLHASAFLQSYTETDTLQSVTARGRTTTNNIKFTQDEGGIEWERNTDRASIKFYNDSDGDTNSRLEFNIADNTNEDFRFTYTNGTTTTELLRMRPDGGNNGITFRGHTMWHAGNFTPSDYLLTSNYVNSEDYITSGVYNSKDNQIVLSGAGRAAATVNLNHASRRVFACNNGSTGSNGTSYSKVGTVTLTSQYADYQTTLQIVGWGNGSSFVYDMEVAIRVKQQNPFGSDPFIEITNYYKNEYDAEIGYVILQNTPSTVVELWAKVEGNHSSIVGYTTSEIKYDRIVWNEGPFTTVQPTGYTSGTISKVYTDQNINPVTGLTHDTVNTELDITFADGTTQSLDLSQYIDDTNLARILSGSHVGSGIVRFTRDDSTTFDVDLSDFFDDTNLSRIVSASWNTSNGVLTLTRNDSSTINVDLDNRYLTSYAETDTLASVTARGSATSQDIFIGGSGKTGTTLTIEATDTSGAPAMTSQIMMRGYEGRGKGIFFEDISYENAEWFAGVPYSGGHSVYQIGFHGSQSEYRANYVFDVDTLGNARVKNNLTVGGTISGNIDYSNITNPPVIDNSVDYINAASFNTGTGVLTLSGVGRAGATVDLDNRYLTGYTETDTLLSVTSRGAATDQTMIVRESASGGFEYRTADTWGSWARNTHSISTGGGTDLYSLGGRGSDGTSLSFAFLGRNYQDMNIRMYPDGETQLYYDNGRKLATKDSGVQVLGTITFDGAATTNSQDWGLEWTGFDKEGTTDYSDSAYIKHVTGAGGLSGSVLEIKSMNDSGDGVNFNVNSNTGVRIKGNPIFHDGYHPNADKWTTARTNTVALSGDVTGTGSASVDGTGNWTVSVAADLTVASSDTFTGTYPIAWLASDNLYKSTWLTINGATDTLNTRNINANGTVTANNFVGSIDYSNITNPPVIDNSVDYINAASFNTSNGVLTLSGVGRAGATVDLDNRYQLDSTPAAPSITSTTVVGETIEVVFSQSSSSGIDRYEVWSNAAGSSYGLIAIITPEDFAASMSVVDSSFSTAGTVSYRVYAIRNGIASTAATASQTFSAPTLEVTNMIMLPQLNTYILEYDLPESRFLDHVEIYVDTHETAASISRSNATLAYSGNRDAFTYNIASSDMNKFHQFWVECAL